MESSADKRTHLWNLRFSTLHMVLANRLYHQQCASILERRDRWAKLISLVGSSAVFMTWANKDVALYWALLSFAGSAAALVFRWSEKARSASERAAQYANVQAEMERVGQYDYTEQQINAWKAKILEITESSANATLWDRVCFQASMALGAHDVQPLSWWAMNKPILMIP